MESVEDALVMTMDSSVDPEVGRARLHEDPRLVAEIIRKLLVEYRKTSNVDTARLIELFVADMTIPPLVVLELIEVFSESRRTIVERALLLNIKGAISYHTSKDADLTVLPRYLREFYRANLPLDLVKATLLAEISKRRQKSFTDRDELLSVFFPSNNTPAELIQKMEEVTLYVTRCIFEVMRYSMHSRWVVYAFNEILFHMRLSQNVLRSILSWLPLTSESRAIYTTDMLKVRIQFARNREEFLEEYLLLDNEFQKLRKLQRESSGLSAFVNDSQNVHLVRIDDDVMEKLEETLGQFDVKYDPCLQSLYEDPRLETSLATIDQDETIFYGRTLKQWLLLIYQWCVKENHTEILLQELQDMKGKCVSGHFRRLINVMNGIAVDLKVSDNEKTRREFFDRVNQRIAESPDMGEILLDIPGRAGELVNQVAREMMRERSDWNALMEARLKYLMGE